MCISASFSDPFLKQLEKQARALRKNLVQHPSHTIDLVFWSDLVGEDVLPGLQAAQSRWLSLLQPVKKLLNSYLSVLCHLLYQFRFHSTHEQQKTVQWLFMGFATWEARLTLAGVADILEICWASKNALEKAASLTAVENIAKTLWAELSSYSRKSSVLPAAMSGEVALPGGNTHAEALCDLYRRQRGQKLRLQYTANSQVLDEWITIKDVENAEAMRVIFRRLGAFAGACSDKVLSRFESKAIWSNMYVFDVSYRLQQESFQTAIWEMGNFLNLPTDTLIDEMRTAFAVRDTILERHTKAEELWCSVLHTIQDRKDLPTAEKLISSFLLAPSQAAACERAFASITQLKGQLGHDCSPSTLSSNISLLVKALLLKMH